MNDIKSSKFLLPLIIGKTCIRWTDKESNNRFKEGAVGSPAMGGIFGLSRSWIFLDLSILLDQCKLRTYFIALQHCFLEP